MALATNYIMALTSDNSHEPPTFSTQDLPASLLPKVQPLADLLNAPEVDLLQLRRLLARGVPDEAGLLREYAWKVALGFLPRERARWEGQALRY